MKFVRLPRHLIICTESTVDACDSFIPNRFPGDCSTACVCQFMFFVPAIAFRRPFQSYPTFKSAKHILGSLCLVHWLFNTTQTSYSFGAFIASVRPSFRLRQERRVHRPRQILTWQPNISHHWISPFPVLIAYSQFSFKRNTTKRFARR